MKNQIIPIILLLITYPLYAEDIRRDPSHSEWEWVSNNYETAMDALLPIDVNEGATVAFRFSEYRLDGPLEFSIVMSRNYRTDAIQVTFRESAGQSLYTQLMHQHQTAPDEQFVHLKDRLKVTVRVYESKTCPSIKPLFNKIHNLSFRIPSPYLMMVDPPAYEFKADSLAGSIDAVFIEVNHPVVKWGYETKSALLSCPYKQ
jgi:hypothetical protein